MIREGNALLGRERELASLGGFLATIAERPAALVLEGEPGIGKTVLLGHAVDEARRRGGYRVLAAGPTNSKSQLAFVGLTDLLSTCERSSGTCRRLSAVRSRWPWWWKSLRGLHWIRVRSGWACWACCALTVPTPVLVAIDDIQWPDPPSAAALSFAFRRLTTEPVGLLTATPMRGQATACTEEESPAKDAPCHLFRDSVRRYG